MTVAVMAEQLPKTPAEVLKYAKRLLSTRPPAAKARTPKGCAPMPRPERRTWGRRLAAAIDGLARIPATNERLRQMMIDEPEILELVLRCRARRHAQRLA